MRTGSNGSRHHVARGRFRHPVISMRIVSNQEFRVFSSSSPALAFLLPIPPSINHQYATVNGRRVLSSKGRAYKVQVYQELLLYLTRDGHRRPAWLDDSHAHIFSLTLRFYFATPLRRDIDGGIKITQDAICEALGVNDNRIVELHVYKRRDPVQPRVECTLSPIIPDSDLLSG